MFIPPAEFLRNICQEEIKLFYFSFVAHLIVDIVSFLKIELAVKIASRAGVLFLVFWLIECIKYLAISTFSYFDRI